MKVLIQRELKKYGCDIKSIEQPMYSIHKKDPNDFLNPTNMKAASTKLYADVVKAPIGKTQDWMKKKKEQILDGSIKWSDVPNGGYVLDNSGKAIKETYIPKVGEVIDRYGPPNGRYTSPVMEGKPYDYEQRSLPYVEDSTKYHQYEVTGDFSRLKDYVMDSKDMELKVKVEAQIERYYNGDYSKVITQKGEIAKGFKSPGGGMQYKLPLPVEWLEGLGMLKEIK